MPRYRIASMFMTIIIMRLGCGQRISKINGCIHLRCGADYTSGDFRGKGCGLAFCEKCLSPLKDSNCGHSTCNRPEKAIAIKRNQEEIKQSQEAFQKYYISAAARARLREKAVQVSLEITEFAGQLLPAVDLYIRARLAYAYSLVFRRIEVRCTNR